MRMSSRRMTAVAMQNAYLQGSRVERAFELAGD